jgi:hypothetical protein
MSRDEIVMIIHLKRSIVEDKKILKGKRRRICVHFNGEKMEAGTPKTKRKFPHENCCL